MTAHRRCSQPSRSASAPGTGGHKLHGIDTKGISNGSDQHYAAYATKMRQYMAGGVDLETEARFVDALVQRNSTILDIGCGHGAAVNGLRSRGHDAFGIDPTPPVLAVALENFTSGWFRSLSAEDLSKGTLAQLELPTEYDVILMSGNVPAFLPVGNLAATFRCVEHLLVPGGRFVIGTTSHIGGGPVDQDAAAEATALTLEHRFSNWHLTPYDSNSLWAVSVFGRPGPRRRAEAVDGIFVLH